jgi:hypothetical protein
VANLNCNLLEIKPRSIFFPSGPERPRSLFASLNAHIFLPSE